MGMNRLELLFKNVPANNQFLLAIYASDPGVWSVGSSTETEGGLQITSGQTGSAVQFQSLNISAKQMVVYAGTDTADVNVLIYVNSTGTSVGGEATLPPGASCTIQSAVDQTNVIQSGSWGVRLS